MATLIKHLVVLAEGLRLHAIYASFLVLALLPMIIVGALRRHVIMYKKRSLVDDLKRLQAIDTKLVQSWGGADGISGGIESYYSKLTLMVPAGLLSIMYLVLFRLAYAEIPPLVGSGKAWLSAQHLPLIRPIIVTFVGGYLFNFGILVRRLYVYDLSDNVYWGCLNRLLLSIGLAVALTGALASKPEVLTGNMLLVFFAIPFMANKVLVGIIREAGARLSSTFQFLQSSIPSSSLQDVAGINVWKEYRLEEEGIEEVQNLATADVIELAVKTHYSLRTLMDWIDQALVINRFPGAHEKLRNAGVNVSAVEMAWQAPENLGDAQYINKLAAILKIDETVLRSQLNAMFEDEYIQTLWTLWQTQDETGRGAKVAASPPTKAMAAKP